MNYKTEKSINELVDVFIEEVKKRLKNPSLENQKITPPNKSSLTFSVEKNLKPGDMDSNLSGYIDHTLLKPDATEAEIETLCREAIKYNFKTVCVNSSNIPLAAGLLEGQKPIPIAVVGFPLGAAVTASKAFETTWAIRAGAKEIDMVINMGLLKNRNYLAVLNDIKSVVEAARPYPVKVILETGSLTEDEKIIGCALSKAAGAAFVKTSTGFGKGGATVEDISLMRRIVGKDMGVKASGGIRSTEDAKKMLSAGADRIGASASVAIVSGKATDSKY